MLLIVRILDNAARLMAESVTPGPSHWKTGVPVTPRGERDGAGERDSISNQNGGEWRGGQSYVCCLWM